MRALPATKTVFLTQLRLLVAKHRRGLAIGLGLALLQIVAMAGFGIILGITITADEADSGVAFSRVTKLEETTEIDLDNTAWALFVALISACFFAGLFPLSTWSSEPPSKRDYHWSLPVDHRKHDLLRAAAGAVVTVGFALVLYLAAIVSGLISSSLSGLAQLTPLAWLCLLVGPLVPYALGTTFAIRGEHPTAWLWGSLGAGCVGWTVLTALDLHGAARALGAVTVGPQGILSATGGAVAMDLIERWGAPGLSWLALWAFYLLLLTAVAIARASMKRP